MAVCTVLYFLLRQCDLPRRQYRLLPLFVKVVFTLLASTLGGCYGASHTQVDSGETNADFTWVLPTQIPLPVIPADNPITEAKFQLGRHFFYDTRLSSNGSISCASCHHQALAFTDGLARPLGATGEQHPRNSQGIANVAWFATLTWGNSSLTTLEQQITIPLFGDNPIEHGINETNHALILQIINNNERYRALAAKAYPELSTLEWNQVIHSLASFVRGITSFNSAFDRHVAGDKTALSDSAKRGQALFNSERLECFHCHDGHLQTNSIRNSAMKIVETPFHNTGLYNIDNRGSYPEPNTGLHEITGKIIDMGAFRAPSLRNVALTAPYNHDGSTATLAEVIRNYAAGGRHITQGPYMGDGRTNPYKDSFVASFTISDDEVEDVVAFLNSLTDETLLTNPRFGNPW